MLDDVWPGKRVFWVFLGLMLNTSSFALRYYIFILKLSAIKHYELNFIFYFILSERYEEFGRGVQILKPVMWVTVKLTCLRYYSSHMLWQWPSILLQDHAMELFDIHFHLQQKLFSESLCLFYPVTPLFHTMLFKWLPYLIPDWKDKSRLKIVPLGI